MNILLKHWEVYGSLKDGINFKSVSAGDQTISTFTNLSIRTARELGQALISAADFIEAEKFKQGAK